MKSVIMALASLTSVPGLASVDCKPWKKTFGDMTANPRVDLAAEVCLILPQSSPKNLRGSAVDTTASATLVVEQGERRLGLAKWRGGLEITEEGRAVAKGSVLAAGQEVWKGQWGVGSVQVSKEFELINIDQKYSRVVMVGVIPANLNVGVRTTGSLKVSAGAGIQTANISAVPVTNSDLYAEAGLGSEMIFIGIQGKVDVLRERLVTGATLEVVPKENNEVALKAVYKGTNLASALNGEINAVVKAEGGFEQSLSLFSWPGYSMEKEIFNGTWLKNI
jgi:hypothetical protein